jgi:cytidylate kinase
MAPLVVAIEGASGTGKSHLAGRLRERTGCAVLELGPLFRCAALIASAPDQPTISTVRQRLFDGLVRGDIATHCDRVGTFAASSVTIFGRDLDEQLWDRRLEAALQRVSADRTVAGMITLHARMLAKRHGAVVIVGHQAAAAFPQAICSIRLVADIEARAERKLGQLGYVPGGTHPGSGEATSLHTRQSPSIVESSEPAFHLPGEAELNACLVTSVGTHAGGGNFARYVSHA